MKNKDGQNNIRVGIIGLGNWGLYGHIPVLQLLPEFEIVAVASRREDQAQSLATRFGIQHAFTDPNELIRHPDVDLVVVLPPAPYHAGLVRAAIAAGKDVYCEWPLTTTLADTEDLFHLAKAAGVRHVVGLQRRLGPSARYVRDLLTDGYLGEVRSVRMHVSMNSFSENRSTDLAWTVPSENFSHILSIYGGHFLDMLFSVVGQPQTVSAIVRSQYPVITLIESGEKFPNRTPDQVVVIGTLANGAVFLVQIEGGKKNISGLQIDITGVKGDLRISNPASFGNVEDNEIEGSNADSTGLKPLPIPERYQGLPASNLDASVLDLAQLYAAYARDRERGAQDAPDFADAVRMHKLIDLITEASTDGNSKAVNFW